MNTTNAKVLACVDQSHFADTVADYAAWAAQRLSAPLELLHVIDREPQVGTGDDHSGTIGIDAREQLLTTLSERDRKRTTSAREAGRLFLDRLRRRAIERGALQTDVRLRHGSLDATIAEQQPLAQLLVLGRRGASAEITQRDLGRNVENLVRSLTKPILAVTEEYRECRQVVVAFDAGNATRRAVELVASSPLFKDLDVHVLTAGGNSPRLEKALAWAVEVLRMAGRAVTQAIVAGDPETVVARAAAERQADLVVMGAYTHSRLRSFFVGSTTNNLLRSARTATLLVR